MDARCGFIINNLQSSRENARQLRKQVNPKGLPILFELYYLKSILLSYIIKLYYLKSFRVTSRHCREQEQLVELYIEVPHYCLRWSSRSSKFFFFFWALFMSSISEFVEKREKTTFKIREFIDFITSIFMTGFEEMHEYHF